MVVWFFEYVVDEFLELFLFEVDEFVDVVFFEVNFQVKEILEYGCC